MAIGDPATSRAGSLLLLGALLLPVLLAGCGGGGSGGGSAAGSPPPDTPPSTPTEPPPTEPATVANPYADEGDTSPTRLGRLVVFGDSYSAANSSLRPGVRVWSQRLGAASTSNYARGTATAGDQGGGEAANDFRNQVSRWLADGIPQQGNDLTVAYLGYNDIQFTDRDLDASAASYRREVDRLLANGAGGGDRKLFVTLVHDWSQTPKELDATDAGGPSKRDRVDAFNRGVVGIANASDDVIAVDLRTVFDRITANPARYGFTNVRSADPAASDREALYFDPIHFGNRGQDIVAQVFRHYLTRGWSWANSLSAGAEATARLRQDIDRGLVFSLGEAGGGNGPQLGFSAFAVGDGERRALAAVEQREADPSRAHFAAARLMEEGDDGIGVNYAFGQGTMVGVVISEYREGEEGRGSGLASSEASVASSGVSAYLRRELAGGLRLAATATVSDDRHQKLDHDGLIDRSTRATFDGRTTALAATLSRPVRAGRGWLQPWASLTRTRQETEGFEQTDPYVSDLRFSGAKVDDTLVSLGLGGSLDPLAIGRDGWLSLSGSLSYSHGVAQDDYTVRFEETGTGFAQDHTVAREATRLLGLRLGADLALGERLTLGSSYGLDRQLGGDTGHEAKAELRYRF